MTQTGLATAVHTNVIFDIDEILILPVYKSSVRRIFTYPEYSGPDCVLHRMLIVCYGNLILNWPKLLRRFKTVFHLISMCMCSQCDSTSLPLQRSQI